MTSLGPRSFARGFARGEARSEGADVLSCQAVKRARGSLETCRLRCFQSYTGYLTRLGREISTTFAPEVCPLVPGSATQCLTPRETAHSTSLSGAPLPFQRLLPHVPHGASSWGWLHAPRMEPSLSCAHCSCGAPSTPLSGSQRRMRR